MLKVQGLDKWGCIHQVLTKLILKPADHKLLAFSGPQWNRDSLLVKYNCSWISFKFFHF